MYLSHETTTEAGQGSQPAKLRFLISESEPQEARDKRRESVGRSSGETFEKRLGSLAEGATCTRVMPADLDRALPTAEEIAVYDAVFLTGSPLHLYDDSPETRRQIEFMRAVFASGTPSFGSCAGLQLAVTTAGGKVRPMGDRREAGFARRIYRQESGRDHPLLRGRPPAFDAPSIHTDEVAELPEGATLLASNGQTHVQAVEIRHDRGTFWGVQYHPEISLREVAAALRRQADDLVEHGLASDEQFVEAHATLVDELHEDPSRRDLAWRLGLDQQVTDDGLRMAELRNFIQHLVMPIRRERDRA
jgi:GMP synthase (glutamine-hydrolysing)